VSNVTDVTTPGRLAESLKMTQRARFLEKFKAAKVNFKLAPMINLGPVFQSPVKLTLISD